jgi:hypothetical protein
MYRTSTQVWHYIFGWWLPRSQRHKRGLLSCWARSIFLERIIADTQSWLSARPRTLHVMCIEKRRFEETCTVALSQSSLHVYSWFLCHIFPVYYILTVFWGKLIHVVSSMHTCPFLPRSYIEQYDLQCYLCSVNYMLYCYFVSNAVCPVMLFVNVPFVDQLHIMLQRCFKGFAIRNDT